MCLRKVTGATLRLTLPTAAGRGAQQPQGLGPQCVGAPAIALPPLITNKCNLCCHFRSYCDPSALFALNPGKRTEKRNRLKIFPKRKAGGTVPTHKGKAKIMGFEVLKCSFYEQLSLSRGHHVKRHPTGWLDATPLSARVPAEPQVAPLSRLTRRPPPRPRKLSPGAGPPAGNGRRGAKAARGAGRGTGAGLASRPAVATAPSRGAATFRPATRPGRRPRPLPRGGSPEFTVRQSVAIAPGLRVHQSGRLRGSRTSPEPPTARRCNVDAPDAAAAFAPPLRCGRRASRTSRASSRRALGVRRWFHGLGPAPCRLGSEGPTWLPPLLWGRRWS